ncbi:hypothetical protein [Chryseobacterium terrae]|uniref:HEAT repeat-containing protein n=1 Tax=Chryseobacterium terrae TaxID=3163299 RepID=A0ABW8XZE3_9FLAO
MVKQKYGTLIFSFLTVISAAISVYFFEKEFLFSLSFAIGSIICALCAYTEHLYEKEKDFQIEKSDFSTEMVINYSNVSLIISFLGYLIFIIIGIYFIGLAGTDYQNYKGFEYVMIAIAFYFIVAYLFKIFKLLKKVSQKDILIINNQGITLNSEKMLWCDIKNERLIKKQEYREHSKYKIDVQYLALNYKNKKVEFQIDDLDQQDYKIEKCLKFFRVQFQKKDFRNSEKQERKTGISIFENILKFNDLFSLPEKELQKNLEDTRLQAKNYPNELELYCESITEFEETNLDSIYYALSEDTDVWKEFLCNEFIRLFDIAKKSNQSKTIYKILEEIFYDSEPSSASRKVIDYLYQELSNNDDKIRLKALICIDSWLDEADLTKGNIIIQKIQKMTKDHNWKIRWCANDILSSYNIFTDDEIAIPFQDKLNAKLNNQYEID